MIVDPLNDFGLLPLVIDRARRWTRSKFVHGAARGFRSTAELAEHIRGLPQLDDDGRALHGATIAADYPVRLRSDPRNPNCVERAAWYLAVAEVLDPSTARTLLTVNLTTPAGEPVRHTNVVESRGGSWEPVMLQPRGTLGPRNASAYEVVSAAQPIAHGIGKAIFTFYGGQAGAAAADRIGEYQQEGLDDWRRKEGLEPIDRGGARSSVDVHTADRGNAPAELNAARARSSVDVRTAPALQQAQPAATRRPRKARRR